MLHFFGTQFFGPCLFVSPVHCTRFSNRSLSFPLHRPQQDMLLGVDVVGGGTIDKLLGPEKGRTERLTRRTAVEDAKAEDSDERPGWDIGDASNPHVIPAFDGNNGDVVSDSPLSAGVAPGKVSAFGSNMRVALAKIAPSSQSLSASDTPIRRVSLHQRLPTAGRLVPVSPTAAAEVLPTASSPEAK